MAGGSTGSAANGEGRSWGPGNAHVQTPRYTGAVYKASGWIPVGTTQGRGRYDRYTKRAQPRKDIWLRPLRKDWKRTLNR